MKKKKKKNSKNQLIKHIQGPSEVSFIRFLLVNLIHSFPHSFFFVLYFGYFFTIKITRANNIISSALVTKQGHSFNLALSHTFVYYIFF
jgi:hypothetical protein